MNRIGYRCFLTKRYADTMPVNINKVAKIQAKINIIREIFGGSLSGIWSEAKYRATIVAVAPKSHFVAFHMPIFYQNSFDNWGICAYY
jgi:hypothetical protein